MTVRILRVRRQHRHHIKTGKHKTVCLIRGPAKLLGVATQYILCTAPSLTLPGSFDLSLISHSCEQRFKKTGRNEEGRTE